MSVAANSCSLPHAFFEHAAINRLALQVRGTNEGRQASRSFSSKGSRGAQRSAAAALSAAILAWAVRLWSFGSRAPGEAHRGIGAHRRRGGVKESDKESGG